MSNDVCQMIARAQAVYARCIDDDRLEGWPDHFHGSCFTKITTAANYRDGLEAGIILANSRGMLTDRVSALREANIYERQSYRHILGQPSILSEDKGEVQRNALLGRAHPAGRRHRHLRHRALSRSL